MDSLKKLMGINRRIRRLWSKIYKNICYIMIELTFLKELILIKQVHWENVIFVTTGIS